MEEVRKEGMKKSREGGWGWMIVAASFVTLICTRSVTRCVSIFFVEFQMHFSTDYSTTSWIHSLLDFTTMICAPLGSYLGNRLSTRVAVMTGGLLSSAGLVLSSFAPNLQFLYISLGILTGLGFALSYTPAVAIVGTYFNERKALAYGIAMSGRGIGIFMLPPLVQHLIDLYSWRGALLTLGALVLHLCVCGSLMRPLVGQSKVKQVNVKLILDEPDVQEDLKKQEEEKSLLKTQGGQDNHEGSGMKMKESNQEEVKNMKEDDEDLMLRDTEIMLNLKISQQDTNSKPTNLKDSSKIKSIDTKKEEKDRNLVTKLTELNMTDSILACSLLSNSKPTDLELTQTDLKSESNLKSNLSVSQLPDPKLPELMRTDSKLSDSIQTDLKLVTSKLPDSQLLYETVSSLGPGSPIKQSRKLRKPKCRPSSEKYSFLLKPDFLLLSVSFLFLASGCSVPFVYLVPYSLSVDISHHQAVLLMSILGVMGIVGNITFGWISDRKCLRTFRIVMFLIPVGLQGLGCLFVPLLRSFSTLLPFSVFYGFFDGAYMALIPVVTCDIVGSSHLSSALGVVGFLHAIPYLISPPVAGWLLDQSGSYTSLFLLCGLSLLCSAFILAALALMRHCRRRSISLQNHNQA